MKQIINRSKLLFTNWNRGLICLEQQKNLLSHHQQAANKTILNHHQQRRSIHFSSTRFLSDRRYSEKHEWVLLDSNDKTIGTVGISQYAQESLGDVVYVQLPEIDSEFNQNDEIGAIESVKAANEIYTPVSGTIIDINKNLEEKPGLINTSCYDDGWLFKIRIKDSKEIDGLMDEQAYEEFQKAIP
uniref:Glycine cleavage system H protein n=1 Tax=Dermatophagoides pteronyssinus TaxID=6956 RepID=A0A6P6XSQ3_DERPT|nr:glycine cleavage system H protein, mitochondrial-like [Dermatophagoides pteronyssinus]